MIRKILVCCLCVAMLVPLATIPVSATSTTYSYPDINTIVVVENGAIDIPKNMVDEVARENPNTTVTFSNYIEAEPAITPRIVFGITITSKTITASNYIDKDVFVVSVAKGATISLTEKWSASLAAEATHSDAKEGLKLNGTITKEYSKTQTFSGPPESSQYNSREFRVRFYADKGTYEGYYETDMGRGPSVSGSFKNPLRYAEYTIDRLIQ